MAMQASNRCRIPHLELKNIQLTDGLKVNQYMPNKTKSLLNSLGFINIADCPHQLNQEQLKWIK
jgi:hypothetical protein